MPGESIAVLGGELTVAEADSMYALFGAERGTDKNSGTCQFFILQNDATYLDGDFAVFGSVVSGMDIVDQIAASVQVTGADGFIAEANQPVITSIKVYGS